MYMSQGMCNSLPSNNRKYSIEIEKSISILLPLQFLSCVIYCRLYCLKCIGMGVIRLNIVNYFICLLFRNKQITLFFSYPAWLWLTNMTSLFTWLKHAEWPVQSPLSNRKQHQECIYRFITGQIHLNRLSNKHLIIIKCII